MEVDSCGESFSADNTADASRVIQFEAGRLEAIASDLDGRGLRIVLQRGLSSRLRRGA